MYSTQYLIYRLKKDILYRIKSRKGQWRYVEDRSGNPGSWKRWIPGHPTPLVKKWETSFFLNYGHLYARAEDSALDPEDIDDLYFFSNYPEGDWYPVEFTSIEKAQKIVDLFIEDDKIDNSYDGDWQP